MKKFLEEIEKNPELKAKIEELDKNPESTPKDFIKAAAEYGVELTEEDFQTAGAQGELADDELDAVAGGKKCNCAIGGGGTGTGSDQKTCACVVLGFGKGYYEYKRSWLNRCVCVAYGDGADNDNNDSIKRINSYGKF